MRSNVHLEMFSSIIKRNYIMQFDALYFASGSVRNILLFSQLGALLCYPGSELPDPSSAEGRSTVLKGTLCRNNSSH